MSRDASSAYVTALTMLAAASCPRRRSASGSLAGSHDADEIDQAIERLKAERAMDDARTAEAIARRETAFRKRGKLRVQLALTAPGSTARRPDERSTRRSGNRSPER